MGLINKQRRLEPNRLKALDLGCITYTSVNPCRKGHYIFYTSTAQCKTCISNNYQSNRDKRIEKMKEYNARTNYNYYSNSSTTDKQKQNIRSSIIARISYWTDQPNSHPNKTKKLKQYQDKLTEFQAAIKSHFDP